MNQEKPVPLREANDEHVASFHLRLERKYGVEMKEPLPDLLIELIDRLQQLKAPTNHG